MANQKISELTQGTPLDTDIIPYVDLATGTTKKALKSELKGATGQVSFTAKTTLTDQATIVWDVNDGNFAEVTLTDNRTLALPTNISEGGSYVLKIIQDATGSRTLTFSDPAFMFPYGLHPTLTTTANAVDIITFFYDGSSLNGITTFNLS